MTVGVGDVELFKQLDDVTRRIKEDQDKLQVLEEVLNTRRRELGEMIRSRSDEVKWSRFRPEYLRNFIEEPYVVEPHRVSSEGRVLEWRVYVPKMVEFAAGRLERATHSYNVYAVNQYMRCFAELPEELLDRLPSLDIDVKVVDGVLLSPPEEQEKAWEKYHVFLSRREGPGAARVKKGSEWELIAKIIEDGGMPFAPEHVDTADLRSRSLGGFSLHKDWVMRDYQGEADRLFMEYGAIGIYWPPGTGKTEYAVDLCDRLKGHKLVVAGRNSTLREQWEAYLEAMPAERRSECHVVLLQSKDRVKELVSKYKRFTLTVYDESHHLPARDYIWLSTIDTKYRLGLTGSPYREDGHINYIMALTGYPHGLAWSKFVTEGIISLAQVQIHVVAKPNQKLSILDQLLRRDLGKTMVFCDSLDLGESIGKRYGIPWVYGATKDRLELIKRNDRVVVSKVGDEGISVGDLDTIIEVDFMGGSRAQAIQRLGRLSHRVAVEGSPPAVHHVLITQEEVEKYGKRLLAYYDKNVKVDWLYGF